MTTRALPDIEDAVIAFLLSRADVADPISDRIYAETPEGVGYPYLSVLKVSEQDVRHWLGLATLQIGAWELKDATGTPRATARDLCEAAVAALHDANGFTDGSAVLGAAEVLVGPRSIPDPVTHNPRFLSDVRIAYHPVPAAS